MEFRVLGSLEVSAAGKPLPLGGPKQRAILALLVLGANTVVPRERLIDDVWGEAPPPEVDATLRVYVARLRKILAAGNGAAILEASRRGYVLRIAPDTIDLNRFESLLASGEEALAAGRATQAAAELMKALCLWRGPALVDLVEDDWVQRETMRLEELRLRALAGRIEADLAIGRHAKVVAELEALVASDPCRERFAGQLMLALYRSGRQPEALQAYAKTRRALHEGFGLEPTRALRDLERRILVQDATLDVAVPEAAPPPTSRRHRAAGVSLAACVVGALVAGALLLGGSEERTESSTKPLALSGNSVVVIDPSAAAITGEVALGGRPSGIAVGGGSVWVGNRDDETLLRIDPRTRTVVRTIGLSIVPLAIAVGAGSVWVVSEAGDAVMEIDIGTSDVVAKIELRGTRDLCCAPQIAFSRGAVWVSYWRLLARIDPNAQKAVLTPFRDVVSIASTARALWAVVGIEADRVQRLEPLGEPIRLNALGATRDVGTAGVAVTDRAVWLASLEGGLARIDADTNRVTASLSLGRRIAGVAAGGGALWIVAREGAVLRADPTTGRVVRTISLGVYPPYVLDTIATGAGAIWVAALPR